MEAIGLNPIRLDAIGIDPIRLNAIRLGVPGASSGSSVRPYIDPEVLASLKAVCICYGKSNDDPDRAVVKNLVDPDNPFVISNAAYTEGSGYADKDSPYYGALVTDGVNDLIISTKTIEEMGITDDVTVVSMIHQIGNNAINFITTNNLRNTNRVVARNTVNNIGKTGIYGWYKEDIQSQQSTLIGNILGDKNDYTAHYTESVKPITNSKFYVTGYAVENGFTELSSVAWYWTIIGNKALTSDQINQVIAYFNLDRTLNPDILCNTIKQGITNENHTEFGDKLIDFSGNGRDIQLNNIAWNKESGIDDNGALCLDGVNDFGQFVGDLGLKDYTFIMDREYLSLKADQVPVISSINPSTDTPFIFEHCVYEGKVARPFSFGKDTVFEEQLVSKRFISYQSTYKYNGKDISKGTYVNTGSGLTIGRYGDDKQYANFALYFLMSFPYSMSEFLIERQLKKHKLGTLYPNMVEFRPVFPKDDRIESVSYYAEATNAVIGSYYPIGTNFGVAVKMVKPYKITSLKVNGVRAIYNGNNGFNFWVTSKSPQKFTDLNIEVIDLTNPIFIQE